MRIILILLLTQISHVSLANTIHFPLTQEQAQEVEWNCKCSNEEQCIVENYQDKSVLTIPAQCSVETRYSYANLVCT